MSKMDTHNQFGFKFYKGGMIPKHQNASGEKIGVNIPYNKEEVDYLRNNFDIINWNNYHTKGMPLKGGYLSYITDVDPDPIRNPGYFISTENKPGLFGMQLPEGYTKSTSRFDLNGNVIGEEFIIYGKNPLENDTTELYNMYKNPTNYKEYIQKHQNASGEKLEEKPKMISISGPNYNETMVEGTDSTGTNKYQFREIEQQGDTTKVLYMKDPKTGQIISVPADSRFNKDFEWMIRNAEPIDQFKKGGSLKKCSCGCKTLLKRGKGGKVMESRNCK